MQDLEPPEVPLEMVPQAMSKVESQATVSEPKKEGFLKKLFSKKDKQTLSTESDVKEFRESDLSKIDLPPLDLPSPEPNGYDLDSSGNVTDLPIIPTVNAQFEDFKKNLDVLGSGKIKNKSKGNLKKGQSRNINKIDESSKFDWEREVKDQEILIHDSSRYNQDVNILISQADKHVEDKTSATSNNIFVSQHKDIDSSPKFFDIKEPNINLEQPILNSNNELPLVDEEQSKNFMKISMSHQKLKSTLEKYLKNKKLFNNRAKMLALFKLYDENVEKKIEDKELELTRKKQQIEKYEKHLKEQEKEILNTHSYIKSLDTKLSDREENINSLIAKTAESELSRRLKIDKKALSEELDKTKKLNTDLKKKTKIIDDDRIRFEQEHQRLSEMERKKLTELQGVYEKKLKELDSERKVFEEEKITFAEKRKNLLALVGRADTVSRDLEDIKKTKEYIDSSKSFVESELTEDKELKSAIEKAEKSLVQEKENLDKMIFDKYLNNNLKNIKPEYMQTRQEWKIALRNNPLFDQISQCRKLLIQRNIIGAKKLYNDIRKAYDEVEAPAKEKEALYTSIRELYNDIQLRFVEAQIHTG